MFILASNSFSVREKGLYQSRLTRKQSLHTSDTLKKHKTTLSSETVDFREELIIAPKESKKYPIKLEDRFKKGNEIQNRKGRYRARFHVTRPPPPSITEVDFTSIKYYLLLADNI